MAQGGLVVDGIYVIVLHSNAICFRESLTQKRFADTAVVELAEGTLYLLMTVSSRYSIEEVFRGWTNFARFARPQV